MANKVLICLLTNNTFFQTQGASLLCGVSAIKTIWTFFADKLFIKSIHKGEINLTGPYLKSIERLLFEVPEVAAQKKHIEMIT